MVNRPAPDVVHLRFSNHQTEVFTDAGLMLEANPPTSVHLGGTSGRSKEGENLHYRPRHVSTVLVAHKGAKFVRNAGSAGSERRGRSGLAPPRQQALEDVGVVVCAKTPAEGTFMAPEMAHHLLMRYAVDMCELAHPASRACAASRVVSQRAPK